MHLRRTFLCPIFVMLIVYTCEGWNCVPRSCANYKPDYLCSCHAQTYLTKVVCSKHRTESDFKPFNVTVQDYSIDRGKKFILNGLNNEIPFEFLSEFLQNCRYGIISLVIANTCPVNSNKSTQLDITKIFEELEPDLEVLNITNSCLTSLTGGNEQYRLQELHLSFNRFTYLPKFKNDLLELRVLDVSNNFISKIFFSDLIHLKALESLNVSYNRLSTVANCVRFANCFKFLLSLKVLDLSHNHIFNVPDKTELPFHIEGLYLNNNNLTELPNFLNYLNNLIHLDLSNNKLNCKSAYNFKNMLQLETIYLNNMSFSNSCNELSFSSLAKTLKIISLTRNSFTNIPFIHLRSNYIFLDLRWNKITTLSLPPASRIFYSDNVTLDVSYNCIQIFNIDYDPTKHGDIFRQSVLYSFRCSFCCLKVIHPLMVFKLQKLLDLSYNMITELNLTGLNNDQPIILNVSHNQITHLLNKNYELWSNISVLDISHNNLRSIVNLSIMPNLDKLYLNNNSLSELNQIIEILLWSNATDVRLAENPWNCNCKMINLILKLPIFLDKYSLTCVKDGLLYHLADIDQLCPSENQITDLTLMWLLIPISIIVTIIIALSLYSMFKAEIMYFMFSRGICLKFVTEKDIDNDKEYDAFISYCHEDEDWVADFLMTGLETGTPAYKLCLHNRDWLGGEYIPDQIVKSVQSSRRTIIVLTENFVKSDWSRMEFDVAYQQTIKDKIPRLIVVLPGDVPDLSEVSKEFKTFVMLTTYIQARKPHFWRKLRASMPRTMNLLQNKDGM